MKALTHSVFGVLMWLTSAVLFGVSLQSPTLFFVVLGSLLPDIDTSSSWIGRLGGPLTQAIERHFGHRTLTHSIIGVICFSGLVLPLYFFRPGWYFSLILGYVSHLTADLFTKAGICLYFPEMSRAVIPGRADWRIDVTQEHYLFGTLALYEGVSLVGQPDTFRTMTSSFRKLTFDHARWQEIEEYQLQSVLVHRGELLVRAVHNAAQTAKSSQPSARISIRDSQLSSELPSTSARTANRLPTSAISNRTERRTKRQMVYTVHRVKQLFVNRLDFVKAGQPIAEVYRKHNPQDTTLLRLRLATEKKLLALARQQIDANIRLIDDDSSAFRKAYEKLNIQGSVFSNHSAKAQQLWKKIHKLASNKAQLLTKRQVDWEKRQLKIAELNRQIEIAITATETKVIRARTDGIVALIEKQVTDQTVTAIISIVTEEQAPPVYGHRKISRHGKGEE